MNGQQRQTVRLSVLGRIRVEVRGRTVVLGPRKQRLVLGTLLTRPNRLVSLETLSEAVWDDEPPRTARKNLQVYVSTLRTLLGPGDPDRIVYDCGGYRLRAERAELDLLCFQDLARAGRTAAAAGDWDRGAELFGRALGLWRAEPFADLRGVPLIRAEAERLEELRVAAYEDWAEAELTRGGAAPEVAETLGELVEAYPLRERLQAGWIDALRRSGRQAEALAAYDRYRRLLAGDLGLAPSPALEALYRSVLSGGRGGAAVSRSRTALPPDTVDFTGRDEQIAELRETVCRGHDRVAVLAGPAGIGKTALAVRVAHLVAENFPWGRLLVRMRAADGSARTLPEVLADLARLVGPAGQPTGVGADPAQALAAWRAWLEGRKVLLVFDDAADEADVRALLPDDDAGAAIVTSRTPLAGLAPVHRMELPGFETAQALELLERIIGAERLAGDPDAAREIVAACGGLPLAVRASGLKLAVLRHLPLREYAARLADPRTALDELAAGDVAVRPGLARGWRELTPWDRGALTGLARLPLDRPFTVDEAADALGFGADAAVRTLENLIGAGLVGLPYAEVTAHAALYSLPRLIHLYAREQVPAEPAPPEPSQSPSAAPRTPTGLPALRALWEQPAWL